MRITCFKIFFSPFFFGGGGGGLASMDLQLNTTRERESSTSCNRKNLGFYLLEIFLEAWAAAAALVCALVIIINFKDPTRCWTRVARICALCVLFSSLSQ